MKIQDWRKVTMQTADNLYCSGNDILPRAIKLANRANGIKGLAAEMTHVAKIVREDGRMWVFESTTKNWNGKTGIQINYFEEWLKHYNGKVYHQSIIRTAGLRADEMRRVFRIKRNEMYGLPYESGVGGLVELMSSFERAENINPAKLDEKARTAEVHCSEGTIIIDQAIERVSATVSPHKHPPARFLDGTYENNLTGCKLGELTQIK